VDFIEAESVQKIQWKQTNGQSQLQYLLANAFSALMTLSGRQEEHPARKKLK